MSKVIFDSSGSAKKRQVWTEYCRWQQKLGFTFERVVRIKDKDVKCPPNKANKAAGPSQYTSTHPWFSRQKRQRAWARYHQRDNLVRYRKKWVKAQNYDKKEVKFPKELFNIAKEHAKKKNIMFPETMDGLTFLNQLSCYLKYLKSI